MFKCITCVPRRSVSGIEINLGPKCETVLPVLQRTCQRWFEERSLSALRKAKNICVWTRWICSWIPNKSTCTLTRRSSTHRCCVSIHSFDIPPCACLRRGTFAHACLRILCMRMLLELGSYFDRKKYLFCQNNFPSSNNIVE